MEKIYQPRINKANMWFSRVITAYGQWCLGAIMILIGVVLFAVGTFGSSWFLILAVMAFGAGSFVYYQANDRINEAQANRINYQWPEANQAHNTRLPMSVTRLNPAFEESFEGRESICDNPA